MLKLVVLLVALRAATSNSIQVINKDIESLVQQFSIETGLNKKVEFLVQASEEQKEWWQTATFYQIYPRSFKDSNGDGIGDLPGIIEKLDYIQTLGVQAIWISPIFQSPQIDFGYDISNYYVINPEYGTMDDFSKLVDEAHKRDLKIIIDFVPNHTSNKHKWFISSEKREGGYSDYYVWADPKKVNNKRYPPNNWLSVFRGSAWEWSETRGQYYLHSFLKEQPDLNYTNEAVKQEMKDILKFWLEDHNIDGVRIDAVCHLVEDSKLRDETPSSKPDVSEGDYDYLIHTYTIDQPETYEIVYNWRNYIDEISKNKNSTKIAFTEAGDDLSHLVKYYGDGTKLGAHFSFNFQLLALGNTSNANQLLNLVQSWLTTVYPTQYTSNWLLGNHDNHRIASRVGKEYVDAFNMLTGFLPGIQIVYSGEEIGMEDGNVDCAKGQDQKSTNCTLYNMYSRDFERTPFQWSASDNADFSNTTDTWLPVSDKYTDCNVADQEGDSKSNLNVFSRLQKIRSNFTNLNQISLEVLGESETVFHVIRYEGNPLFRYVQYDYIFNFGNEEIGELVVSDGFIFPRYQIVLTSGNSDKKIGAIINPADVLLKPYEALILTPTEIEDNGNDNSATTNFISINLIMLFVCIYCLF